MAKEFLSDIETIRERARRHLEQGAVIQSYKGDRETVLKLLNETLASEIVCVLRYKRHYYMAKGINSQEVAEEFQEHAAEEQEHVDWIAERIVQLGGAPDFSPEVLASRSHTEYKPGGSLREMIEEDLVAERVVIETYGEIVRYLGERDATTRRLMERILEVEEEHAEDLASLLVEPDGRRRVADGRGH